MYFHYFLPQVKLKTGWNVTGRGDIQPIPLSIDPYLRKCDLSTQGKMVLQRPFRLALVHFENCDRTMKVNVRWMCPRGIK